MIPSEGNESEVVLRLTKEEALVFFEFVARFSQDKKLNIEDQAEERVLWDICCMLESRLVEPLTPEYANLLASAREKIRDKEEPNHHLK
jgi:hypothetical protein